METSAGEPLISTRPFAVTKCSAWLMSNESPIYQAPSPVILKSATVSHPTLLSSSPYNPAHKNTRVTDTLSSQYYWETKQACNGWPVSRHEPLDITCLTSFYEPSFTLSQQLMLSMYGEVPDMCPGGYRVAIRAFSCTERKGCLPAVGPFVFHLREHWGISQYQRRKLPASLSMDPRNVPYYMDCEILWVEGSSFRHSAENAVWGYM